MNSLKKRLEKRMDKLASHHAKVGKIVIVPDDGSLIDQLTPRPHSSQVETAILDGHFSQLSPQIPNAISLPSSSNVMMKEAKPVTARQGPVSPNVAVAQLIDLSIDNPVDEASTSKKFAGIPPSPTANEDATWAWTTSDSPAAASKLLLYLPLHVQYHLHGYLPVRDLLSLAQVNRLLRLLTQEQIQRREKKMKMQLVWRKDFIRYINQSYNAAQQIALMKHHVFGAIWHSLF